MRIHKKAPEGTGSSETGASKILQAHFNIKPNEKQVENMTLREVKEECEIHYCCGDCKIKAFCQECLIGYPPHTWEFEAEEQT